METKQKLKLYGGILFGKTGNTIGTRFKLIGTIALHGTDNLYEGIRFFTR